MNTDQRSDDELNRVIADFIWGDKRPRYPDFTECLNACHEAEKVMRDNPFNFVAYTRVLWEVVFPEVPYTGEFGYLGFTYVTATSRQRAEALVRVIEQQKGQK